MALTRKTLAETIEGYDAEIAALQLSKRTIYEDYRHQLAKSGHDKDQVKSEIEAFKLALRRKAAVAKSSDEAVNAKDDLVDEIFAEITAARAPRATRVREATPEHDADGVIIEPEAAMLPQTVAATMPLVRASAEQVPVESSATSSPEAATESDHTSKSTAVHIDAGNTGVTAGETAPHSNVTPFRTHNPDTHFLNSKGLLRLHGCSNPEACAGSHRALCNGCATAAEQGSAA